MLKKRLGLIYGLLGAGMVMAPVAAVVSCGDKKEETDLSKLVSNKDLKSVKFTQGAVLDGVLLNRIAADFKLDKAALAVKDAKDLTAASTKATIVPADGNTKYTGSVDITFTFVQVQTLDKAQDFTAAVTADTSKTLDKWDTDVIAAFNAANNGKELATGAVVNYYLGTETAKPVDKASVKQSDPSQNVIHVDITAAAADMNWTGTTTKVQLTAAAAKTDLSTATALTLTAQAAVASDDYAALDTVVITAFNTANATHTLAATPVVAYYTAADMKTPIAKTDKQAAGTIYAVITAAAADSYWTGSTEPASFELTAPKTNLSTATAPTLTAQAAVPADNYAALDTVVITAFNTANATHNIAANAVVTYYTAADMKTSITKTDKQAAGTIYAVITADAADAYWTGSTTPAAFTLS